MFDDSFWRESAREAFSPEASPASVALLFALAVQRAGGEGALVRRLGLTYSELRTYLNGEAMPPQEVLSQALQLVVDAGNAPGQQ